MITQTVDLAQLEEDIVLLHSFVHGDEDDSVVLGDVNTPSLRNLVRTIRAGVASLESTVTACSEGVDELRRRIDAIEETLDGMGASAENVNDQSTGTTYGVQVLGGLVPTSEEAD